MFTYTVKRIKYGNCDNAKVMIYSAKDTLEMAEGLKDLPQHNSTFKHQDLYCGNSFGDWEGVHSRQEAWDLLRHGTNKKDLIRDVKSYLSDTNAGIKVKKYRDVTYRPFGSAVCVPRMLTGNPNCMILPVRTPIKTRNIKLLIDAGVSACFSAEDYKRVGSVLGRAIADIERAGYRVRLNAVSVTDNNRSNREFICMNVLVKGENEPLNLQRILYPAAEASFERVLAFTAIGRAREWSPSNSNYPVSNNDSLKESRKRLYDAINGEDTIVLRMQHLCSMIRSGSIEEVKTVIKTIFKELQEGDYKGDKKFVW